MQDVQTVIMYTLFSCALDEPIILDNFIECLTSVELNK